MTVLPETQVQAMLGELTGWTLQNGRLHREYKFKDFIHAFGFMAASAVAIEAKNHHPDWSNVWNRVTIDLWTHSAGGITPKDFDLARTLEEIARKLLA